MKKQTSHMLEAQSSVNTNPAEERKGRRSQYNKQHTSSSYDDEQD